MDPNLSAVVVGRGHGSSQRTSAETQRLEVPHRPEHPVPGDLLRLRHAPNAMTRQAFPHRMLRTATDNKLSMECVYKHPFVVLSRFGTEYLDVCLRRYIPNAGAHYDHPLTSSDPRYAPLHPKNGAAFDRPGYVLARPVFRAHFSILEPYTATRHHGVPTHMALEAESLERVVSIAQAVDFYKPDDGSFFFIESDYPPLGQSRG